MGTNYFVVKEQAVPEVLLKVVEAKKLLDTGRVHTVNEAADQVGISRSSFISTRMTFFSFMKIRKEPRSHLLFRWKMNLGFCQMC